MPLTQDGLVSAEEFAGLMVSLGPFEPHPHLAVAVSGGADSLALAVLARGWTLARGGSVSGLVVDHGLRAGSAAEAAVTVARLEGLGVDPVLHTLTTLRHGPGLAERARTARYAALEAICAARGIVHLLLGHHAGDQVETQAKRLLDGSGPAGLAGMAALSHTRFVRRLRPLLGIAPARLRAVLRARGLDWVEDPSNADAANQRARLRLLRGDRDGDGPVTRAALRACMARGRARAAAETEMAALLAARARIYPQGYAVLAPGPIPAAALGALLRMVAGSAHAPSAAMLAGWPRQDALGASTLGACTLGAGTLGGVRIQPAGRLGPGWLLTREVAAMAPAVPARDGVVWDGRFRFSGVAPEGAMVGALGASALPKEVTRPPFSVRQTLPALWRDGALVAVPHLRYYLNVNKAGSRLDFTPSLPAAGAAFTPVEER